MSRAGGWVTGRHEQREAATAWASAGKPVFPCRPGAKTPLTTHGHLEATADLEVVQRWWTRWPRANVAIPTGTASGLDVLDVDVRVTGSGLRPLERLMHVGVLAGRGAVVSTPSSGFHLYFPADPDRPQRSWSEPTAHIDFRGDGGYVLVPGSEVITADGRHGVYQVLEVQAAGSGAPLDAQAVRHLIAPRPPRSAGAAYGGVTADVQRLAAWVAARVEGGRATGLFWAACRLAEAGVDRSTAVQLELAGVGAGLSEHEARRTVDSAYRRAGAQPERGGGPAPGRPPVRDAGLGR